MTDKIFYCGELQELTTIPLPDGTKHTAKIIGPFDDVIDAARFFHVEVLPVAPTAIGSVFAVTNPYNWGKWQKARV